MHGRTSLRRTAEFVRSWLGHQERWLLWRPLEGRASEAEDPALAESCFLSASTVHRWLDRAGIEAKRSVAGQLREIPCSGEMGTDGLWARLRGGGKRVVLALADSVSGVIWPPVVATDEERATSWQQLFERAEAEGPALRSARAPGLSQASLELGTSATLHLAPVAQPGKQNGRRSGTAAGVPPGPISYLDALHV
jgi:hypothetical protein